MPEWACNLNKMWPGDFMLFLLVLLMLIHSTMILPLFLSLESGSFLACHKCYKNLLLFWDILCFRFSSSPPEEGVVVTAERCHTHIIIFAQSSQSLKTCLYFVPLFFSARQIAAGLASQFDTTNFTSDTTRQLSKVGKKSLSDDEMKNLSSIISQMGQIYGEVSIYICGCTHSLLIPIFFILFVHLNYPVLLLDRCHFATISITV